MVEICSIGSLLERKRTKAKDKYHNVPVYAVTNNRGFVLSSSLHDFDIFSDDTSNYMVVSKNDFAYNPSRLNVGSIAYFKEEGNGLISPMYVVFHADENKILAEYLYIVIKSEFVRNKIDALKEVGARFRFDFNRWGLIKIPIPSLEEQTRIVGILDTFTSAIDNLKEQIAQRRKQYEYYRDQLFYVSKADLLDASNKGEVIVKYLDELGTFTRGRRFVRTDIVPEGVPCIHYGDMYTYYGISAEETPTHLTKELSSKLRFAKTGDVVIVAAGENDLDIGVGVAWLGKEPVVVHDACFIYEHKMVPKYVSHFMRSRNYHQQIRMGVVDGKICSISAKELGRALIAVPSLQEQQRIVSILDTFEASIQNLEAQLKEREKQYEYYRNKLLTF